jgi:hypothetical protein
MLVLVVKTVGYSAPRPLYNGMKKRGNPPLNIESVKVAVYVLMNVLWRPY